MKKSAFMHDVSVVTAIWGFLALIGAWLAGDNGTVFGWSAAHCYQNATVLMLISVSAGVCALYRFHLEHNK